MSDQREDAWPGEEDACAFADEAPLGDVDELFSPAPIAVALVCPDPAEREALADALVRGGNSHLRLVAAAPTLGSLNVPRESVDVLVVADTPGTTLAAHAAAMDWMRHGRTPRRPVLYTGTANGALLRHLSCHGADIIVGRTDGPAYLRGAVCATRRRDAYHSPAVERALDGTRAHVTHGARKHEVQRLWPWLSRAETDLARLLGYGLGCTAAAGLLRITVQEARGLRVEMLAKLGARDMADFDELVRKVGLRGVLEGKRKGCWMPARWRLGQVLVGVRDGEWVDVVGVGGDGCGGCGV